MVRGNRPNKIKIGIGFPVEAVFVLILATDFAPPLGPLQALSYPLGYRQNFSQG
jgi:hypothetical protein